VADLKCAGCGGSVQLEMEQDFVICPFCGSTLFAGRASSFKEFCFDYIVSDKRAESFFKEAMKKIGVREPAILSRRKVLLPFLVSKSEGSEITRAAFTPHPSFFENYSIPSGTPLYLPPEAKEWGELVVPQEEAFLYFETTGAESPSVYHVPFYEFTFGIAGNPLKAFVDGVAGNVHHEPFPFPSTAGENRMLLAWFVGYFLLFALVSGLIRSVPAAFLVSLAALILTVPLISDTVMRKFK